MTSWVAAIALTMQLLIASAIVGLVLAIALTLCLRLRYKIIRWPILLYIGFMRGTPLLVQLFLIYFGLSQFEAVRDSFLWMWLKEPFVCALLTLSLNSAAYTTVLFDGALRALPAGEDEAGQVLGLNKLQRFMLLSLPRAMQRVWPAYNNEVIMVLKSTSLISTITLLDVMGLTRELVARNFDPIYFLWAALFYLAVSGLLVGLFRLLEKWLFAYQWVGNK